MLITIVGREASVVSGNMSRVLSNHLPARVKFVLSEEQFVETLTSGTWIVGPMFSSAIVRSIAN